MFNIGIVELTVIAVIAIIVIGPDKLPIFMKTVGKTIRGLRQASRDIRASVGIDEMMREDYLRPAASRRMSKAQPGTVSKQDAAGASDDSDEKATLFKPAQDAAGASDDSEEQATLFKPARDAAGASDDSEEKATLFKPGQAGASSPEPAAKSIPGVKTPPPAAKVAVPPPPPSMAHPPTSTAPPPPVPRRPGEPARNTAPGKKADDPADGGE